jgi:hypothetical protein
MKKYTKQSEKIKQIPRTVVKKMGSVLARVVQNKAVANSVKNTMKKGFSVMKNTAKQVLAKKVYAIEKKVHSATKTYAQSIQSYVRHQCVVESKKTLLETQKQIQQLRKRIELLEKKIKR